MAQLTFSFLGRFHVGVAGQSSVNFESDKVRSLLAYLAVESDRAHSRVALAALLWPGYTDESARANLRHTLHQLRQSIDDAAAFPPFLLITRQTIQFNPAAPVVSDAASFAGLLTDCAQHQHQRLEQCPACLTRLRQAVDLYRGDFLQGLPVQESDAFEEWRRIKQEQFHLQTLEALHHLADAAEARGDLAQARRDAMRQLDLEPWRETAHRQIMRILAIQGERSAAIAQYHVCREVLRSEFGADLDPVTTALYEKIRTGEFAKSQEHAPEPSSAQNLFAIAPSENMGESTSSTLPNVGRIYGREKELAQLTTWLVKERARLVAVLGMGGIGKTTLTAAAAHQVSDDFQMIIWRSLVNAPPLGEVLREIVLTLSGQTIPNMPVGLDDQLALLLEQMRRHRCLIVLDNMESVLEFASGRTSIGSIESYSQLLQLAAEQPHKSCLLLTSRERPRNMARWESSLPGIHNLRLSGLDDNAVQSMLASRGLHGRAQETQALSTRYSGNPLAIKLAADTVQDLFAGDIATFLRDEAPVFDDIRTVIDQQLARLSPLEQDLLIWLAIEREPATAPLLRDDLVQPISMRDLLDALRSLQRHSLLEQAVGGVSLQNVIIEHLTDGVIDAVCQEIECIGSTETDHDVAARLEGAHFNRFALLKATAKEYVRQSQARLIVQPIGARLKAKLGAGRLQERLRRVLSALRNVAPQMPGYAAGNVLNILTTLGLSLKGWDFSQLCVWQAHLAGVDASETDFSHAQVKDVTFTDAFAFMTCAAYSADGALLAAGSGDSSVKLWRTADGQASAVLRGHTNIVEAIAYSSAGDLIASGSVDASVRLWDVANRSCRRVFSGHTHGVYGVAFSPDGLTLASASEDATVRLWDVQSGVCRWVLRGHTQRIHAVSFSPSGATLVSASEDRTVRLWDVRTGQCMAVLEGHQSEVSCVVFGFGGDHVISGSRDNTIRVWNLHSGETEVILREHTAPVRWLALSADGALLASASNDKTIRLWRTMDWRCQRVLLQGDPVAFVAFSPQGHTLAAVSQNLKLQMWHVASGHALRTVLGYSSSIWSVAASRNGASFAIAGEDQTVYLWDAEARTLRHKLRGHTQRIYSLAFHPAGALLASGCSNGTVRLWEINSGRQTAIFQAERGLTSLAFSPDGALLIASSHDQTVYVWNTMTGERVYRLAGHTTWIEAVAFSPDGGCIASGSHDRTIRLWDTASGECTRILTGHTQGVSSLAFDPSGRMLASASWDATVRLWDAATGQPLAVYSGHENLVWRVAFHPCGKLVASASADRTVRLWSVETGQEEAVLTGHCDAVMGVAFSPDGATLYSGGADGVVKLWSLTENATPICRVTLTIPGPYAGMKIDGVTGVTDAQKAVLKMLGAVGEEQEYHDLALLDAITA